MVRFLVLLGVSMVSSNAATAALLNWLSGTRSAGEALLWGATVGTGLAVAGAAVTVLLARTIGVACLAVGPLAMAAAWLTLAVAAGVASPLAAGVLFALCLPAALAGLRAGRIG